MGLDCPVWEQETENPKAKVAGRANYNRAIINEIDGNMETAIQWAKKAYADYKIKLALGICQDTGRPGNAK